MGKTLIIGYGSTLRSDDGVGYLIAERLMEFQDGAALPADVQVIARQQLTPDLADDLSQADRVIFIDAAAEGEPGEIRQQEVRPTGEAWGAFVHEMSPSVLLDCIKEIYHRTPEATLITIAGSIFDIGEGLTEKVQSAADRVVEQLVQFAGEPALPQPPR